MREPVCGGVHRARTVIGIVLLSALPLASCGGGGTSSGNSGGGSGGGNPPPQQDFQLSVPASVTVQQGSATPIFIGVTPIDGLTAQVSIMISGIPTGIAVSPSSFLLSPGAQQQVNISATANATQTTTKLTVTGVVVGSVQHSAPLSVTVTANTGGSADVSAAARVKYLETDTQWDTGFLTYFPQRLILFDPGTKRFFLSDPSLNRVFVIDAQTEQKIAEIPVPGAFAGDETPDHETIYLGTQIGDVYAIDPVSMSIKERYPAIQIGPYGFAAYEARVLADGRLALLGGQGGIPAVDGYSTVVVWNPATNDFVQFGDNINSVTNSGNVQPLCGGFAGIHIGEFALTADRTQILVSSADSDGTLCMFNPDTGAYLEHQANDNKPIMTPPDGKEIIAANSNQVTVLDSTTLQQLDQFQVGGNTGSFNYVLSQDGNTLYAVSESATAGMAINWKTHQTVGWFFDYDIYDNPFASDPLPLATDSTGLIASAVGHGVAFLDGSALFAQPPTQGFSFEYANVVQPSFGPVQGGTQVALSGVQLTNVADVLFGSNSATVVSTGTGGVMVNTPAGSPGPVDVSLFTTDNNFLFLPQDYNYGPAIIEVRPSVSTADGGASGTIYGYGFGSASYNGQAPGLQLTVGGQPATITQYLSQPYSQSVPWYPFPLEAIQFTIPPGSNGTGSTVTASNSAGSASSTGAIEYIPAAQQFPLSGAVLVQGIYDPHRDVYYFTDQTQVRVFSKTLGEWLTSIPMPASATRLWGISLSPDGSRLAVSDAGANQIYVLDPDMPSTISTFPLPNTAFNQDNEPCGLAISDSGIVYYASFSLQISGNYALHKLDTSDGLVTDYQFVQNGNLGGDALTRVLLSMDNSRVYANVGGSVFSIDTATDTVAFNPAIFGGDYELALSSNQTWMSATEYMMDTNLNPQSYSVYVDRDVWNVSAVYGEKLSPDGNLLFLPLTNAIDVIDGHQGTLLTRIALPVTLSSNYDALVDDGQDNVIVAITGNTGSGIAVVDLSPLAEPLAAARARNARLENIPLTRWTSTSMASLRSLLAKSKTRRAAALSIQPRHDTSSPALTTR
jgi:IPT/TIG domain